MGFGLFMISNESTSAEETNSPLPKSCAGSLFSPCSSSIMDGQSVSNHLFFTPSKRNETGKLFTSINVWHCVAGLREQFSLASKGFTSALLQYACYTKERHQRLPCMFNSPRAIQREQTSGPSCLLSFLFFFFCFGLTSSLHIHGRRSCFSYSSHRSHVLKLTVLVP